MLTVGSVFSGIGGLDLGLERAGMEVRWQVENDDYCSRVLAKHWPDVPRYGDIKELDPHDLEPVDLVCGGFPCPDISSAGLKVGIFGKRSSLWLQMARVIRHLRPRYVVVENVGDLLVRGLDVVLGDLAAIGFDAEWSVVPACAVGAPHPRRRVFIVAHPSSGDEPDQMPHDPFSGRGQADWKGQHRGSGGAAGRRQRWLPEPPVDRVADGVPWRVVRPPLGALGNAVVPQVAEYVGRCIVAFDSERAA